MLVAFGRGWPCGSVPQHRLADKVLAFGRGRPCGGVPQNRSATCGWLSGVADPAGGPRNSIKAKVAIKKVPKAFEDLIDAKRIVREIKLLSKYLFKIKPLSSVYRIL